MTEPRLAKLDSTAVRVLAHPLRSRLLERLRRDGPATATQLAAKLGSNSGTTSYHLRKLAEVGLVLEEADSGDGRDRWWRAGHDGTTFSDEMIADDDPDTRAALDWLTGFQLRASTDRTQAWFDVSEEWPEFWPSALVNMRLYLTAAQVDAMNEELHAVLMRYREIGRSARDNGKECADVTTPSGITPEDLVPVAVVLHVHPEVQP